MFCYTNKLPTSYTEIPLTSYCISINNPVKVIVHSVVILQGNFTANTFKSSNTFRYIRALFLEFGSFVFDLVKSVNQLCLLV